MAPAARHEEERPTRRREERTRRREEREPVGRRAEDERSGRRHRDEAEVATRRVDAGTRYSSPPRLAEPEEPWDSPRRWQRDERPVSAEPVSVDPISASPISAGPISAAPRSGGGRHSAEDEVPVEADYWRPPVSYVPDDVPVDDTPTLVDLASRRALRASGEAKSRPFQLGASDAAPRPGSAARRRRANADAVDGAYWAGLRGEAR
ncbi:hypothetical protein MRQ36_05465 [Micromonospora sp. R77]|uniref:hypothetical protein n=1 Tax=Micromonospora sp. R77 TaxID=2925836 RepID=UPI001F61ECB1|nr:hypothetical protein [Micromonospora sp. R77]MCI4062039.1 hypothetical protein [Micromonospora sp. R77]